jgi:HlyD family secretion protein
VKRRVLWFVVIVLTVAALSGGYLYSRSAGSRSPYRTASVTRGPLTAAISATGTLNAVITVQVGSQVSGNIKELHADFNSQVKKGQVIARIDPEMFQAQVNQAAAQRDATQAAVLNQQATIEKTRADLANTRAALASAHAQTVKAQVAVVDGQRNFGRQHELRQRDLISQSDLDAAQVQSDSAVAQYDAMVAQERAQEAAVVSAAAQLRVAEAQLENVRAQVVQNQAALRQAEINLEHTVIVTPVDGVVVSRTVDVGQTVAASLQAPTLFTIAQDLTKMQVDTNVAEADVGRVEVGHRATFTVDAFPGRTFRGEVVQIRKAAQVLQNVVTYDVVVNAANPDLILLPTMTANVRIITEQRESVLQVPNAALRFRPPGADAEPGQRAPGAVARGGPGGGGPGGAPSGGRAGNRGRVWVLDPDGKPKQITVQVGITDGTSTEVVAGDLTEQQSVIVGLGGDRPAAPAGAGGPRLRL